MTRFRSVLRWVFVRGPLAAYELADSGSGVFTWLVVGLMALGAGIGSLVGLVAGTAVSDAAFAGLMVGLGLAMAGLVLVVVVVAVAWVRGVGAVDGEPSAGRHTAGRHSAGRWRRPGEPLVPAGLVGFFVLMTVAFGGIAGYSWYESRSWDEATAVVDGSVVAVHEPSVIAKSPNKVDIRYTVGGQDHTIRIDADPGDHFLRMGDTTPVEYSLADPNHARAVWAVESNRSDVTFWGVNSGICGVFGIASGVGYLVGRRRLAKP